MATEKETEDIKSDKKNEFELDKVSEIHFDVKYEPTSPVILNAEKQKELISGIKKHFDSLLITEDDYRSIVKRGGTITKLRQFKNKLNEHSRNIHDKAKLSYEGFDKQVKEMTSIIDETMDSLVERTDDFIKRDDERKENEFKKVFEEQLKDHYSKLSKFTNFEKFKKVVRVTNSGFDNDKRRMKAVIDYLELKLSDFEGITKAVKKFSDKFERNIFAKALLSKYASTEDLNGSIVYARDELDNALSLIKKAEEESERLKQERQAKIDAKVESKKTSSSAESSTTSSAKQEIQDSLSNITVDSVDDGVDDEVKIVKGEKFVFELDDKSEAKKLQKYLNDNGYSYKAKIVPIE